MPNPVAPVTGGREPAGEGGAGAVETPSAVEPRAAETVGTSGTVAAPVVPAPALAPEGWAWLWVESEPAGMRVVVDGVPVGRTPQRVDVEVTPQGFARHPATIRVRFVAESAQQTSVTTELVLTPRDRVPVRVHFTRDGVLRRQ